MWLAERSKQTMPAAETDLGVTTIAGGKAGVMTRGEVRSLPIFGPGGFIWMPENGDAVLVLKGGPGGQEQCVAGIEQPEPPAGMVPGEIVLHAGGSSVWLRKDGSILLNGRVNVTGSLTVNGIPCAPIPAVEE